MLVSPGTENRMLRLLARARHLSIVVAAISIAVAACDRPLATAPQARRMVAQRSLITVPADHDAVMGNLSAVARHLAAALQDSAVRSEVANAMHSPNAS